MSEEDDFRKIRELLKSVDTSETVDSMNDPRIQNMMRKLRDLRAKTPEILDRTLSQADEMRVVTPLERQMKIDQIIADRDANRLYEAEKAVERGDDYLGDVKKGAKSAGKKVGKKALSMIPLVGLAAALSSGDANAAMPLGTESTPAGETPEQEDTMIAERDARQDYDQSQARKDKLNALSKLKGR